MEAKMRTGGEPQVSSGDGYAGTNEAGRAAEMGESGLRRKRDERQLRGIEGVGLVGWAVR